MKNKIIYNNNKLINFFTIEWDLQILNIILIFKIHLISEDEYIEYEIIWIWNWSTIFSTIYSSHVKL